LALHGNLAAQSPDDAVADGKAQARTLADWLGGEKRLEDAAERTGRDAPASVRTSTITRTRLLATRSVPVERHRSPKSFYSPFFSSPSYSHGAGSPSAGQLQAWQGWPSPSAISLRENWPGW
jgi:hypothetical protein